MRSDGDEDGVESDDERDEYEDTTYGDADEIDRP
jgi:hypothetical protein